MIQKFEVVISFNVDLDPLKNCHLNVKKIENIVIFSTQNMPMVSF